MEVIRKVIKMKVIPLAEPGRDLILVTKDGVTTINWRDHDPNFTAENNFGIEERPRPNDQ